VELKFLHSCHSVGHIEDIVISKEYRHVGLGKQLVERLVHTRSFSVVPQRTSPFMRSVTLFKNNSRWFNTFMNSFHSVIPSALKKDFWKDGLGRICLVFL